MRIFVFFIFILSFPFASEARVHNWHHQFFYERPLVPRELDDFYYYDDYYYYPNQRSNYGWYHLENDWDNRYHRHAPNWERNQRRR